MADVQLCGVFQIPGHAALWSTMTTLRTRILILAVLLATVTVTALVAG